MTTFLILIKLVRIILWNTLIPKLKLVTERIMLLNVIQRQWQNHVCLQKRNMLIRIIIMRHMKMVSDLVQHVKKPFLGKKSWMIHCVFCPSSRSSTRRIGILTQLEIYKPFKNIWNWRPQDVVVANRVTPVKII